MVSKAGGRPDAQAQIQGFIFATLLLDPEMTIVEANNAAEEMLGKSAQRMIGAKLRDVIDFGEKRIGERLGGDEAQLVARGTPLQIGERSMFGNVTVSPLPTHPGWRVLTLTDAGQDDMARVGPDDAALVAPAVLAHEIKNPLAAIRGAGQLVARKLDDKDRRLATVISDEVDRIARLVDRMQGLGAVTTEPLEAINLHEAIRSACRSVRAGSDAGFVLEEEFDPSIPPVVASRDALEQVIGNLVANARNATAGRDDATVCVRTRFVSGLVLNAIRLGRSVKLPVEVRISDNGPGIDPKIENRIFEPFVTGRAGGQGLGLALVKKLVDDMNGRISYERDASHGWTHFRVHLAIAS